MKNKKEEGAITISIDGREYKISYCVSDRTLSAIIELCGKIVKYDICAGLKSLVRESGRISRNKNIK